MKSPLKSKTIILAALQAAVALLVLLVDVGPPAWVGVALGIKSVLDIAIRYYTTGPIKAAGVTSGIIGKAMLVLFTANTINPDVPLSNIRAMHETVKS